MYGCYFVLNAKILMNLNYILEVFFEIYIARWTNVGRKNFGIFYFLAIIVKERFDDKKYVNKEMRNAK
jgi:hypothetical protein